MHICNNADLPFCNFTNVNGNIAVVFTTQIVYNIRNNRRKNMSQIDSAKMMMYMIALVERPSRVIIDLPQADLQALEHEYDLIHGNGMITPTKKGIAYVKLLTRIPLPEKTYTTDLSELDLTSPG